MKQIINIIICQRADDALKPGNLLGISCALCDLPLQVSDLVFPALAAKRDVPLCNPCGFIAVKAYPNIHVLGTTLSRDELLEGLRLRYQPRQNALFAKHPNS